MHTHLGGCGKEPALQIPGSDPGLRGDVDGFLVYLYYIY